MPPNQGVDINIADSETAARDTETTHISDLDVGGL
jgi:hypothetical protein